MKKYKNVAFLIAEAFALYDDEVRKVAIDNFNEFFVKIPEKYKKAVREALTTPIKDIPEFVYLEK